MPTPILAQSEGPGVVEGKLINGTDPKLVASGVELDVVGLGGGMTVLKTAVTDASGSFRIDGLPTAGPLMVRASYHSVNYHSQIRFDSSNRATVTIEIFEPTASMKDIRVEGVRFGFQMDGKHLRALETCSFVNETKPRKSFMSMDGSFRFSKPQGISQPPRLSVQGPGSQMPLTQSPLESADGSSYYSLHGLRPGNTVFEVDYVLPYHDHSYRYVKRFFHDIPSYQIGIIPRDMKIDGEGLVQVQVDEARNFAWYAGGPVKAGAELVWTFSGGTPVSVAGNEAHSEAGQVKPMPTTVARNALFLGPLILTSFIVVLWYAFNRLAGQQHKGADPRVLELKKRRERLLDFAARLDHRQDNGELERRDYVRQHEQARFLLRRISLLLGRK